MKKITLSLFLIVLTIMVFSQEEFIYSNIEFGLEVKFPSKPLEHRPDNSDADICNARLNLISAGLFYNLLMQKNTIRLDMVNIFKSAGLKVIVKSKYEIEDKYNVTEFEVSEVGACTKYKQILYKKGLFLFTVAAQSCAQDKDVFPFFNSIKINGIPIQNPNIDNSKFISFAIEYPSIKTDTVKQIVYVNSNAKTSYQFEKLSDIDQNIPSNNSVNLYRFALIIGNEDYSSHQVDLSSEINVDFARNDATAFKEYAINTLGIPEKNVIFLLDATTGQMNQGISKLNLIIKNTQGKAEVFVYYAGHGLPDEQTKEAYIMPVDVSGKNANEGIPLKILYSKLTEFPSKRITVFIDACFSGGARNSGLLAARGVKVKPKEGLLNGNLVVFSASSGEQSSLPLKGKYHGIFTYYLLKKIQETKGDINYDELSKSIIENVSLQSVLINDKEQSPQISVSSLIQTEWKNYNLK
jgi:hypothetical protein